MNTPKLDTHTRIYIVQCWSECETWFHTAHVYAHSYEDAVDRIKRRKQGLKGGTKFTLATSYVTDAVAS